MKRHTELQFAPIPLSRGALVSQIMEFVGLPYSEKSTALFKRENGKWCGRGNCFGGLLCAARELGLLPPRFNLDLPPMLYDGQSVVKSLWEIIDYNFNKVAPVQMLPGDVVLTRYHDQDPLLSEPHHVLACVAVNPVKFFHFNDTVGYAHIVVADELMWNRVEGVYACKNFDL